MDQAEDGEQALAAIAKQQPDLILMDIQLPIMDGYTAVSRIKAYPALRSIPIIAVTSYALNGEEQKARAAGCLFEHWLKIKNRAAPAVKREAGPRTAIKSSNKSAWPFDMWGQAPL